MNFNFRNLIRLGKLVNFLVITLLSFFLFEAIEHLIFEEFNIDLAGIKIGWLAIILIYGFKYHIICCLVPLIWATYQCRHKKCDHEHCDKKQN